MRRVIIYIHGKGGNAEEANHYRPLFPGSDVVGLDYTSQNPWDAKNEFPRLFDSYSKGYDEVILIANSIGAFFAMSALAEKGISRALFISPIVNMEKLIADRIFPSSFLRQINMKIVQQARLSHQLTQEQMAAKLGLTPNHYGRFERGEIKPSLNEVTPKS